MENGSMRTGFVEHKHRFRIIQFIVLLGFLGYMAEKVKNQEINTPQLTSEEKELINAAMVLAVAQRRKGAIAITLNTLAKHIETMLPKSIDINEIKKYIKAELAKKYKIVVISDRIGNDQLQVEVVLLYSDVNEVLEAFRNGNVYPTIKVVDAGLDSVEDYKKQNQ
jgi:hypothetical protein